MKKPLAVAFFWMLCAAGRAIDFLANAIGPPWCRWFGHDWRYCAPRFRECRRCAAYEKDPNDRRPG